MRVTEYPTESHLEAYLRERVHALESALRDARGTVGMLRGQLAAGGHLVGVAHYGTAEDREHQRETGAPYVPNFHEVDIGAEAVFPDLDAPETVAKLRSQKDED